MMRSLLLGCSAIIATACGKVQHSAEPPVDAALPTDIAVVTYAISVVLAGEGSGTVTSSPEGIDCPGQCSIMAAASTEDTITLTARPTGGSTFAGWSGGGCSGTDACTVTLASVTITASFNPPPPNLVFATSTSQTADYGGVAGADVLCQARADAAGLSGTYRAFLSTSTATAISRLGAASGWVRPDGKPVANTTAELAAGKTFYPIRLSEFGVDVLESIVHTAALTSASLTTCNDYTVADAQRIVSGASAGVSWASIRFTTTSCATPGRLYCFGIDHQSSIKVVPAPSYRRAFVTSGAWRPGGGSASADALCTSEAFSVGLPGTYKALLATTTASAASRFDTTRAAWARIDGVLLTPTAAALFALPYWDSAVTMLANGAYSPGNDLVWSGATSITAPGTAAETCSDWKLATGSGEIGASGTTEVAELFGIGNLTCNATGIKLTCLQE